MIFQIVANRAPKRDVIRAVLLEVTSGSDGRKVITQAHQGSYYVAIPDVAAAQQFVRAMFDRYDTICQEVPELPGQLRVNEPALPDVQITDATWSAFYDFLNEENGN
ncbi:MAG: hypothetical protein PVI21_04115 [Candidatus Woesebacteria bacterium]|jgi:hypothetical protein